MATGRAAYRWGTPLYLVPTSVPTWTIIIITTITTIIDIIIPTIVTITIVIDYYGCYYHYY